MERMKIKDMFPVADILDGTLKEIFYHWNNDATSYPDVQIMFPSLKHTSFMMDYYINHSFEKWLSPFAMIVYKESNEDYSFFYQSIADIIYNRFHTKWKKLWDALNTAYKPLENYAMEEERTPNLTKGRWETTSGSANSKTSIYGFNGIEPADSSENSGSQSGSSTISETETGYEKLKRTGNIGVTTSQQMLESEFEIRKKDIYNLIYNDIDSILCLEIY